MLLPLTPLLLRLLAALGRGGGDWWAVIDAVASLWPPPALAESETKLERLGNMGGAPVPLETGSCKEGRERPAGSGGGAPFEGGNAGGCDKGSVGGKEGGREGGFEGVEETAAGGNGGRALGVLVGFGSLPINSKSVMMISELGERTGTSGGVSEGGGAGLPAGKGGGAAPFAKLEIAKFEEEVDALEAAKLRSCSAMLERFMDGE